jgi:hypothetical protein
LKEKFSERFGMKDPPSTVRWNLSSTCQYEDEDLETYVARIGKMVGEAHPDANGKVRDSIAIDHFLKGCRDSEAAIAANDRSPKTLHKAYKYVKKSSYSRKALKK